MGDIVSKKVPDFYVVDLPVLQGATVRRSDKILDELPVCVNYCLQYGFSSHKGRMVGSIVNGFITSNVPLRDHLNIGNSVADNCKIGLTKEQYRYVFHAPSPDVLYSGTMVRTPSDFKAKKKNEKEKLMDYGQYARYSV